MKKLLLTLALSLGLALVANVASADPAQTGYHDNFHDHDYHGGGGRDWGYHGYHGEHYDYHYRGHGWVWGFPPPPWFVMGVSECREYSIQRVAGYDVYGNPVYVVENHMECTDQFGVWIFVR